MKFNCTQENLHQGLSLVSHIASRASTLPILTNILFEAKGSTLTLSATNLEIGICTKVRGRVENEGIMVVPARLINECVALLPKENVTLFLDGKVLYIQSGSYNNKIHTLPPDDFPLLPTVEEKINFQITTSRLRDLLNATLFAVSFDDTRPELSGVYFSSDCITLTAAATDSYRLAEKKVDLESSSQELAGVIIPLRTMQEVARALTLIPTGEEEKIVKVSLTDHQVSFHMGDTLLISRLIDGQYPHYQEIIPNRHESSAIVECDLFAQALKAASLFSKAGMNDIYLTLLPGEGGVRVRAVNIHVGENTTIIPATVEGKEVEVVVNWKYLSDGLQSFSTDTVGIEVTNASSMMVLRPQGTKGHLYLVMPIRQ